MKNFDCVRKGYTFDDLYLVPKYSEVSSRRDPDISGEISNGFLFKVPIVSANMGKVTESEMVNEICRLGGTGCIHRFMSDEELIEQIRKVSDEYFGMFGISIGVDTTRTENLLQKMGKDILNKVGYIVIDIAHGHHFKMKEAIKHIKNLCNKPIIAGNICTVQAAKNLIDWGADTVKVGLGSGAMCSTRLVAGVGYPQLSAIREISTFIKENSDYKHAKIISDGGMRYSGDVVKSLAAGAHFVMLGGMLSGAKETPGNVLTLFNGNKVKIYEGSASINVQASHFKREAEEITAEGVSTFVKYKGGLRHVIKDIIGGIKSGFSYMGCSTLCELHEVGSWEDSWVKITGSGRVEGTPHGAGLI